MKRKFDILFEDIMEYLNSAEVNYKLNSDFEKQTRLLFTEETFEKILEYVQHMQRKYWMDPEKQEILKNLAFEFFGDDDTKNPVLFLEKQKLLKKKFNKHYANTPENKIITDIV